MKLVVMLGAGAVGKMTVGQELSKQTGLQLYHNHLDIELTIRVFGNRHKVGDRIRRVVFEEFAKSLDQKGLIFTFMLPFDIPTEWDYLDGLVDIFRREGADIYYVELVAAQEVRIRRNTTENRLTHKASKRDVEASQARMLDEDATYRLVSNDGEIPFENYMKIDNTDLPPDVVAKMIADRFTL